MRYLENLFLMDLFPEEHLCEWCGRTFTLQVLARHLPFCKEHFIRYGKPMNPASHGGPAKVSKLSRAREVRCIPNHKSGVNSPVILIEKN